MKIDPLALVQAIERYLVVRGIYILYSHLCFLFWNSSAVSVESVKNCEDYAEDKQKVPVKIPCSQGRRLKLYKIFFFWDKLFSCGKHFSQNTIRSITALLSHWL